MFMFLTIVIISILDDTFIDNDLKVSRSQDISTVSHKDRINVGVVFFSLGHPHIILQFKNISLEHRSRPIKLDTKHLNIS